MLSEIFGLGLVRFGFMAHITSDPWTSATGQGHRESNGLEVSDARVRLSHLRFLAQQSAIYKLNEVISRR